MDLQICTTSLNQWEDDFAADDVTIFFAVVCIHKCTWKKQLHIKKIICTKWKTCMKTCKCSNSQSFLFHKCTISQLFLVSKSTLNFWTEVSCKIVHFLFFFANLLLFMHICEYVLVRIHTSANTYQCKHVLIWPSVNTHYFIVHMYSQSQSQVWSVTLKSESLHIFTLEAWSFLLISNTQKELNLQSMLLQLQPINTYYVYRWLIQLNSFRVFMMLSCTNHNSHPQC